MDFDCRNSATTGQKKGIDYKQVTDTSSDFTKNPGCIATVLIQTIIVTDDDITIQYVVQIHWTTRLLAAVRYCTVSTVLCESVKALNASSHTSIRVIEKNSKSPGS